MPNSTRYTVENSVTIPPKKDVKAKKKKKAAGRTKAVKTSNTYSEKSDVCHLVKNVSFETTSSFQSSCALKCLQDVFCAGYNFKKKQQNKKPNCQLTHKLDHDFHSCHKGDKTWNFYHPVLKRKVHCNKVKYPKEHKRNLCANAHVLDSKMLSNESKEFTNKLREWLPQTGNWKICWRATRDGWQSTTFHAKCDSKVPTLTIVKVVENEKYRIFGGYATATWNGDRETSAPGSFFFSLLNKDNLPPFKCPLKDENDGRAITRDQGLGPVFGCGYDLYIVKNPHLKADSYTYFGCSYEVPSGYTFETTEIKSLLAGSFKFIPSEIEVLYLL